MHVELPEGAGVLKRGGYIYFPDDIYKFTHEPDILILGVISENIVHQCRTCKLFYTSILQSKHLTYLCITLYWKKVERPSIVQLYDEKDNLYVKRKTFFF